MFPMRKTIRSTTPFVALLVSLVAGCQTAPKLPSPWSAKPVAQKETSSQPKTLAVMWTDAVYNQLGSTPTRGFGGRLYFYDEAGKAVPVQGRLVVYAFDDTGKQRPSKQADRTYEWTAEELAALATPSELGDSYSVWVPWDGYDGQRRSISLLPVFQATDGQVVMGKPTLNVLPGTAPEAVEAAQPVVPASHETAVNNAPIWQTPEGTPQPGMARNIKTTTINVPPPTARRLQ